MPNMTGVQLCEKIREAHTKGELPILLISSLNSMDDMVRGYEAGADDYLVKPVRTPEFLAKVALLLRQKRAHEQAMLSSRAEFSGVDGPRAERWIDEEPVDGAKP